MMWCNAAHYDPRRTGGATGGMGPRNGLQEQPVHAAEQTGKPRVSASQKMMVSCGLLIFTY